MHNFSCSSCSNKIYFRSVACLQCEHALGFDPETMTVVAVEPLDHNIYSVSGDKTKRTVSFCKNHAQGVCNWLTPPSETDSLCIACSLNRTIPNLSEEGNLEAWRILEQAKKRLIYSLLRFGLPLDYSHLGKDPMVFDFIREAPTGHLDGVITIDIRETDAVELERQRQQFKEPYRSVLGHLRHESGHYYWSTIVDGSEDLDAFRELFGDERVNYGESLQRHHENGPPPDWQETLVSAYASAHPWEDWAETWAHYLHIVDAVDTAEAEGMEPRAQGLIFGTKWPFHRRDVYREESFYDLMDRWFPLTLALNSLARSIGHDDFYPFIIPAAAQKKLAFIHHVVRKASAAEASRVSNKAVGEPARP